MDDSTVGYGGGVAPRIGVMAGKAMHGKHKKMMRGRATPPKGTPMRVPTSVQSDANKPLRGGAVDLEQETDSQ